MPTEIHPDPFTWTQAPPTADQSFQPGASAISPTPPECSKNQAVLEPYLSGEGPRSGVFSGRLVPWMIDWPEGLLHRESKGRRAVTPPES